MLGCYDGPMIPPPDDGAPRGSVSPAALLGALAILTAAVLAMRLVQARESFWVDELHTSWVVAEGPAGIAARAKAGNQPPLYFYLVWLATRIAGWNELALRLPSILAGTALAPLSFVFVHRLTRSAAAAFAAAMIAALDRDFLFYATEARAYALVQLLAIIRLAVFLRLLDRSTARMRTAYVGVAALMFHLHYTTALIWIGEGVCVAVATRLGAGRDYRLRRFLSDSALLALLCLPAAPHVAEIFQRRENWEFIPRPTPQRLLSAPVVSRVAPWVVYLAPGAACWIASNLSYRGKLPPQKPTRQSATLWLVTIWIMAPVAAAWLLSITDVTRLFFFRYLTGSAAALPLLAGLFCGGCNTTARRRIASTMAVAASVAISAPLFIAQYRDDGRWIADRQEDWRSAVNFVNQHEDRATVFVDAGLIECREYARSSDPLLRSYCLLPVTGMYAIDRDRHELAAWSLSARGLSPEACERLKARGDAWFLCRSSPPAEAKNSVLRQLSPCELNGGIAEERAFGSVTVLRMNGVPTRRQ